MVTLKEVDDYLKSLANGKDAFGEATQDGPDSRINGVLVHRDFTGVYVTERQRQLWERLRQKFGQDSNGIGMIFTYSPYEYEEMFREDSA
ncbi:MAG TPA: hypothetical protein VGL56_13830 [Fimbriimonadaceae bacterium]|jgi:hypothetical protein